MPATVVASARPVRAVKAARSPVKVPVMSKQQKVCPFVAPAPLDLAMLPCVTGQPGHTDCCPPDHATPLQVPSESILLVPTLRFVAVQLAIASAAASYATFIAPAAMAAQEIAMTAEVRPSSRLGLPKLLGTVLSVLLGSFQCPRMCRAAAPQGQSGGPAHSLTRCCFSEGLQIGYKIF